MKTKTFGLLFTIIFSVVMQSCQKSAEFTAENAQLKAGSVLNEGTVVFWGQERFIRNTGDPALVRMMIGSEDLACFEPIFILHVRNGDGISGMVSSAIIKIDGKQIFGVSDFSQKVTSLSKEISGLTAASEIEVEVRGIPGSFLDIRIEGYLKPGRAIVGENGGSLTSDDGLLSILLPAGSVSGRKILSALETTDFTLPGDLAVQLKGPVYSLLPDDITFQEPVTVRITFDPALFINVNNIRILHWDPVSGYEILVPEIDQVNHELVFDIAHFSFVGVFESGNSFMVNHIEYPLNKGFNVWFSELDCGNRDIYAHGIYLTSDITISRLDISGGGFALLPYGKGHMLIFNLFNKNNSLTPGKYTFVDDVDCSGMVKDGDMTFTMGPSDQYVTALKSMNDPTSYCLNADLDIDWAHVDFNHPAPEVMTKYMNYVNSRIALKEGSVTVVKNGSEYVISFDCTDINGLKISGSYTGNLTFVEFGI